MRDVLLDLNLKPETCHFFRNLQVELIYLPCWASCYHGIPANRLAGVDSTRGRLTE